VLYDLLGRREERDSREATVASFVERYHVDRPHGERVAALARKLYDDAAAKPDANVERHVGWAALLHEVGYTVSHLGFHKHGAYILGNADMPGFSRQDQQWLALLVLGCRGGLDKVAPALADPSVRAQILALRLACCSTTRASRSRCRASASRPAARTASRCRPRGCARTRSPRRCCRRSATSGARPATRGSAGRVRPGPARSRP
jgi:exopolyphosphatase/pppGpp-phosphohydrolase